MYLHCVGKGRLLNVRWHHHVELKAMARGFMLFKSAVFHALTRMRRNPWTCFWSRHCFGKFGQCLHCGLPQNAIDSRRERSCSVGPFQRCKHTWQVEPHTYSSFAETTEVRGRLILNAVFGGDQRETPSRWSAFDNRIRWWFLGKIQKRSSFVDLRRQDTV